MPLVVAVLVVAILATAPSGQHPTAPFGMEPAAIAGNTSLPSGRAERLPPGPLVVESAPDRPDGALSIAPGVTRVRAAAGESVQPEFLVMNGAQWPLDLALAVTSLSPGPDGAPSLTDATEGAASMVPSAATWVRLPASQLHLDPGEQARLRPTISVPELVRAGGYVTALRVRARPGAVEDASGNPEVVAFLLVEVPGIAGGTSRRVTATAALMRRSLSGAEASIRLAAEQSEVVAGRLKVSAWWGATLVEVVIPPTLVLAAVPRTQEVGFQAPFLPGPYALTASLETSGGETVTASATAWLWNPLAMVIALLVILLVSALIVTRPALRRRP